jgi:hypothetical protein
MSIYLDGYLCGSVSNIYFEVCGQTPHCALTRRNDHLGLPRWFQRCQKLCLRPRQTATVSTTYFWLMFLCQKRLPHFFPMRVVEHRIFFPHSLRGVLPIPRG